ncbi:hypothetical protein DPMN_130867 [Dreissena polymorpha]|uniref:Uncharacterized protein n=1 Tax=Dreissena polymorpha TaxID=45954 RepID=A0A9D4H7H0_DREPO|nr:hypothetical protein DPMN_130867 [Dreissena polymorpha]
MIIGCGVGALLLIVSVVVFIIIIERQRRRAMYRNRHSLTMTINPWTQMLPYKKYPGVWPQKIETFTTQICTLKCVQSLRKSN